MEDADLQVEHDGLQEEMLETLEARKRKLREDFDNFDMNNGNADRVFLSTR
jgi:hypothetical protein